MSRKPISDLDLYSNLKRRTADPHSGWSTDNFVARVNSKMDTKATTVRVSRAPALIGVASVLAVLLVLVVALPNLRPGQSATPEPSPSPPGAAMSPAEFQMRFAAGELNGQSVLVNGRIEASDMVDYTYAVDCNGLGGEARGARPAFTCTMGRIVGTQPNLWAEAPYLAEAPESWRAAASPAEGTLVLYVTPVGFIHYIGTVAVTAGEPTSARAAGALHLDSLDLDDVVLVNAWLGGQGGSPPCVAEPETNLDLPTRGCPHPSWVSDSSVHDSAAIDVQRDAYFDFAVDPGDRDTLDVAPRYGTYALAKRLEACGETPCWQWTVVARLSGEGPLDVPTSAPTPLWTPPPATPGVDVMPTTVPATDPIASPLTPPEDAMRFECSGPPPPLGMTPVPEDFPTLIDETGLVTNCAQPDIGFEDIGRIRVEHLGSDATVVYVVWPAGICSSSVEFTLSRSDETNFDLAGQRPTECQTSSGANVIQITFREPVESRDIQATIDGGDGSVDPGPRRSPLVVPGCGGVTDETGLIERCAAADGPDGDAHPVTVANPDGDFLKLEISWADVCEYSGEFAFRRATSGYELIAFSDRPINVQCDGFPQGHVLTLYLRESIAAETVQVTTPPSGIWECAGDPQPDVGIGGAGPLVVTLHDETGLAWGSCRGLLGDATLVPATNPGGDAHVLQLNWTRSPCQTEMDLTFSATAEGFLAHGVPGPGCLLSVGRPFSLVIFFSEPVNAADVTLQIDLYTPPPNPT